MHLLPMNLAPLASICAKENQVRFGATNGVKLSLDTTDQGPRFTAYATNSRQAIRVVGYTDDVKEYPTFPALDASPNGETSSIIPASDWKTAFAACAKTVKKTHKPTLQRVACVLGKDVSTLAAHDMEKISFHQPRNVEGRFPDVDRVLPESSQAYAAVTVDPYLLAEVLEAVGKLGTSDENKAVTLELHGKPRKTSAIVVRAAHRGELAVDAVVVPLVKDDTTDPRAEKNSVDVTTVNDEEYVSRADYDALMKLHNANVEALATAQQERDDAQEELAEMQDAGTDPDGLKKLLAEQKDLTKDVQEELAEMEKAFLAELHDAQDKVADLTIGRDIDADRISQAWKIITELRAR